MTKKRGRKSPGDISKPEAVRDWSKGKIGVFFIVLAFVLTPIESGINIAKGVQDVFKPGTPSPSPSPTQTMSPAELARLYDNTNPTDCSLDGAPALDSFTIRRQGTDAVIATAEVRHSTRCSTSWVRVTNSLEGTKVVKRIDRRPGDGIPTGTDTTTDATENLQKKGNEISFGGQLYAPARVDVSVQITDAAGTLIGEMTTRQVCTSK
jgi:hypothetical protein